MAIVRLSKAPAISGKANYRKYESWLLENFFKNFCAYCFRFTTQPQIDHYEPKKMSPQKYHGDPLNLLISCGNCNGKGMKSDYHPNHALRVKVIDHSGHLVHNMTCENLNDIFFVDSDGSLKKKYYASDRAYWLISLFDLDSETNVEHRKKLLAYLKYSDKVLTQIRDGETFGAEVLELLQAILIEIRNHEVFYMAFDIAIPALVQAEINKQTRTTATI